MDHNCLICLTSAPSVTLYPCAHTHLCAPCAVRLENDTCPTCRQSIVSANFSQCSARPFRDFPSLLSARRARDSIARDSVAQVLLAGPREAEHMGAQLLTTWASIFALQKKRKWRKSPATVVRNDRDDEVQGLPYTSRFEANAIVDGTPVRFSWIRFPDSKEESRGLVADLQSYQPDFLLLTASLHVRRSLSTLLIWDSLLRRMLLSRMPQRMWIFLAPPKFTSNIESFSDTLNFKDDVAAALGTMPELQRPLTFHVLEPGGWLTRAARKVAQRSVFHACRQRQLRPTNGV